jgi:Uncharacterized protein conserved in bacteria
VGQQQQLNGKKVSLVCGGNILRGWESYDCEKLGADVMALDLNTLPLPFEDESLVMIFAENVLEHCSPSHALAILDECYRSLKAGGIIRLSVSVLTKLKDTYARDIINGYGNGSVWNHDLVLTYLEFAGFKAGVIRDESTARYEAIK